MQLRTVALVLAAAAPLVGCGDDGATAPHPCEGVTGPCTRLEAGASGEAVLTAFLQAQDGDTIGFGQGRYDLDRDLSLTVSGVTLLGTGKGDDGSVLSFAASTGAQGVLITGDRSRVEGLAVIDTPGDALKWEGVDGVTVREVRTAWTGAPRAENGAYGIYPVQCQNVLIEDSEARGASDAGIYVGQSDNIIVRRNLAHDNVAGIEIENSTRADVYANTATKNTGGVLVFSLPGLQIANGAGTRVFDNQIIDNNTLNFAPAGNIVADVPTGSGVILLAGHQVEIFDNVIENHSSLQIGIAGYNLTTRPFTDPNYNPFSDAISIHDNDIRGVATMPSGPLGFLIVMALLEMGQSAGNLMVPSVIWDGDADPTKVDGTGELMAQYKICVKNNTLTDFGNLRVPLGSGATPTTDAAPHNCDLPAIPAVTLP